jgi:hypothetical protein
MMHDAFSSEEEEGFGMHLRMHDSATDTDTDTDKYSINKKERKGAAKRKEGT